MKILKKYIKKFIKNIDLIDNVQLSVQQNRKVYGNLVL